MGDGSRPEDPVDAGPGVPAGAWAVSGAARSALPGRPDHRISH